MRILFLATGFWFALSLSAQDLLYMQRGNPGSLLVNPAADVDARVWLSLPSINTTAQTSFAAGDVLGGDLGTLWRQFPSEAAGAIATHDMGLFSMGFKAKKSTFWLGSSLNFEGNTLIDRDLVGFLLWGMKDANGDIDLNYDGRFEQTSAVVSARSNLHLGWQREFGSKLRVGATLNATQILGHAVMGFDSLGLRSVDRGNGFNELELYTQGYAAAYTNNALNVNLFDGTFLFDGSKLAKNSLISLDLGGTYQLTKNWMLAASYQGLGFEGRSVLDADTAIRFEGRVPFSGFSYNSSTDTAVNPGGYFDTLLVQIQQLGQTSTGSFAGFGPLQRGDLAGYWRSPKKTHQLGLHYLYRARPTLNYQALAAEYHGFFGRRWQLSASYTQPLRSSVAMRPSVSVHTTLRLAGGLALSLGSSTVNMMPLPVQGANGDLTVGLPRNMDRLNVNVGLHWMLYEKSYRKAAQERRAAKKAKRQERKKAKI
jgi:hypothetical protein